MFISLMPNYEILPLSAECFGQFQLVIMAVLCTECIQRSSPSGHRDGAQFAYWDEWSVKRRVAYECVASARWIFTAYSWAHSGLNISAGLIITQLGLFFVLQLRQLLIAVTLDCTATVTLTLIFTCTHTLTHIHSFSSTWQAHETQLKCGYLHIRQELETQFEYFQW